MAAKVDLPRDLTIILDASGSMSGVSIIQAKAAIDRALDSLSDRDRFGLIVFGSDYVQFAQDVLPATAQHIQTAKRWLAAQGSRGGTNMAPALSAAMAMNSNSLPGRLSQIVFVTDGLVSNERALFGLIDTGLGKNRLFTVGIGSAPNSYFITEAARAGRGASVYIGDQSEVAEKMGALLRKLASPILTDLRLAGAGSSQVAPDPIPDLYPGDVMEIALRNGHALADPIILQGRYGDKPWSTRLSPGDALQGEGIAKLFARKHISALDRQHLSRDPGIDPAAIKARQLALALEYGLVTALTSLVAVEKDQAIRPAGENLLSRRVPNALPRGWDFGALLGEGLNRRERLLQLDWKEAVPEAEQAALAEPATTQTAGLALPKTGYDFRLNWLIAALALFGVAVMVRNRP